MLSHLNMSTVYKSTGNDFTLFFIIRELLRLSTTNLQIRLINLNKIIDNNRTDFAMIICVIHLLYNVFLRSTNVLLVLLSDS